MAAWASAFLANWASVASRCLAWASASATRSELTASARASRWESRLTSWPRPVSRLLLPLALLPDRALAGLKAHLVAGRGGHRGLDGREGAESGDRHGRHAGEHGHRGQAADEGDPWTPCDGLRRPEPALPSPGTSGPGPVWAWAGWLLAWARRGSRLTGWGLDRLVGGVTGVRRREPRRSARWSPIERKSLAAGLRAVVAGHTALSTQPWTSTYCNGMVTDVRNRCL